MKARWLWASLSLQRAGKALLGLPGESRATTSAWVSAEEEVFIIIKGLLGLAWCREAYGVLGTQRLSLVSVLMDFTSVLRLLRLFTSASWCGLCRAWKGRDRGHLFLQILGQQVVSREAEFEGKVHERRRENFVPV